MAPHMLQHQQELPRLPVPDLKHTLDLLLQSCRPLADSEAELRQTQARITEFLTAQGPTLQQRLIDYDKTQRYHWLEEHWLSLAYLTWQEPVLIHSNWAILLKNHPNHPERLLQATQPRGRFTPFQVQRAAGLAYATWSIKEAVDAGQIEPEYADKARSVPIDMHQWSCYFGTTRWPGEKTDTLTMAYPNTSQTIMLLIRHQVYIVKMMTPDGKRISPNELARHFQACVVDAGRQSLEANVPILTSEHRLTWAQEKAYAKLLPSNKANFDAIKETAFAVCLDDVSVSGACETSRRDAAYAHMFHAGDGTNRWFDKAFNLIVTNDGRAGVNGEHAPLDALVASVIMRKAVALEPVGHPKGSAELQQPVVKLRWKTTIDVEDAIRKAHQNAISLIESTDAVIGHIHDLGGQWMKETAKIGPDAFMQMVLQIAFYRLHHHPCGTYESASLRKFNHGRTETLRTCSDATVHLCKLFMDGKSSATQKYDALMAAAKKHNAYGALAAAGKGGDRHLLMLRMMQRKEDAPIPLFSDPLVQRAGTWQLSTSNVSPASGIDGMGFGPVVHDGYGINYSVDPCRIIFSVAARKVGLQGTNAPLLRDIILHTSHELRLICEEAATVKTTSKL